MKYILRTTVVRGHDIHRDPPVIHTGATAEKGEPVTWVKVENSRLEFREYKYFSEEQQCELNFEDNTYWYAGKAYTSKEDLDSDLPRTTWFHPHKDWYHWDDEEEQDLEEQEQEQD